jgi:hypothetical protein
MLKKKKNQHKSSSVHSLLLSFPLDADSMKLNTPLKEASIPFTALILGYEINFRILFRLKL